MKKTLLISQSVLAFILFMSMNVSAQEYYFIESFATGNTPDGWEVKDVSYSNGSQAPNQIDTTATYSAKMKTNNLDTWIQFPKVSGVTDLSFWCKLRDPDNNPVVKIQSSTNATDWTDVVTNPAGLDLTNTADFQYVTIPLNIDGGVYIRIYIIADGGSSSKGMLYVDDIALGKPAAATDDVALLSLSVGGNVIDGFDLSVTSYTDTISHVDDYTVTAETNNSAATAEITQVSDITGSEAERTATVVVTSEDKTTTATTTIVFVQTDYWYKTGFPAGGGLEGWSRSHVFQSGNIKIDDNPNLYGGEQAIKFTGGPAEDPGILLSPKMKNVGTLSFLTGAQEVFTGQSLRVFIMHANGDSTEVVNLADAELAVGWQEVSVDINEFSDSIQIQIIGICDIGDAGTSRIWMDDFLVTYKEDSSNTGISDFNSREVTFYPNPVKSMLNFKVPANSYQGLEIFNMQGQSVMQKTISAGQKNINVDGLSKGVYMMSFTGKTGTYTAKFIKE